MLIKRHIPAALSLAAAMILGSAVVIAAPASAQDAPASAPIPQPATAQPAAPAAGGAVDLVKAKQTFETTCSGCHEPSLAASLRNNRQGWEALVDRMVGFGLTAPEPQLKEIVDYLTATYPAP